MRPIRFATSATLLLFTVASSACRRDRDVAWTTMAGGRWAPLEVAGGTPGFTEMSARSTGIRFENSASDRILLGNRILAHGGGVAMGDVDGDGRPDVFLAKTEGCSALFRNQGDFSFEDISRAAGVALCDRRTSGSVLADVDGDGDLDLLVSSITGPNALFVNDGRGHFTERTDAGLDSVGRGSTTLAMADVDASGRLALFVANYKPYNVDDTLPPQARALNQMVRQVGPRQYEVVPEHRRDYKLVMRPDMGGMRLTQRAEPDAFYANDGTGRFTRVPMTAGRFLDAAGKPLREELESFALAARFADLNGDGAPDLYVANDFEDPDALWFNDGHGTFRLADWRALRTMSNASMGLDIGDVNGDGHFDIFTTDMLADDSVRLHTQIPTHTALPKKPGEMSLQLQQQRNSLHLNRGDGTFAEAAQAAGVSASGWSWGTLMVDVDLDGWQDLLVANGHRWDIMDADTQERLQNRLTDLDWRRLRWQFPRLPLANVAWRNRGDGTFESANAAWRFGRSEDISHGLATADLDGDGDLDVVVNRLDAPALVLRNDATAPRVAVALTGSGGNTRAVGARVTLVVPGLAPQVREVAVGGRYLSHSDYAMSFAMHRADSAQLLVRWRDGRESRWTVRPNRRYELDATTATATASRATASPATMPLFADATAQLGGHRHVENRFDDWDRQYLLPQALSQLGPGAAWHDLDRDGDEDLVIGAGQGGHVNVFRNDKGRLTPQPTPGPVASADFTALIGLSWQGRPALLAGVATWEMRNDAERKAQPAAVWFPVQSGRLGATAVEAVGSHASSTGPLAVGDYSGDGALDLFVGSRAMPLTYPVPVTSGLFRQVGGAWVLDTLNMPVLRDIGLVSSATFTDVNGDGHADLLLAREWDTLVLLLNDGAGRLVNVSAAWGLTQTGRWNAVATGDVNGDGRLDLVATNWGRNTGLSASSERPLVMTYGPFGAGGEVEMLLGRAAEPGGAPMPVPFLGYARVRLAVQGTVDRVNSFGAYAQASVQDVLGPLAANTRRASVTTLDHLMYVNRGNRFDAAPLPFEAQLAPAFGVAVADFDGDGNEDVVLAQNFFPTVVGFPRFDAGRGLLLRGDGRGAFTPLDARQSGLAVYGDQRAAAIADFNADGRYDLVVTQNGDSTRLFVNQGARPGLRVRLNGTPANPDGIGAMVQLRFGRGASVRYGPAREVQTASGYWAQHGAVQLFGAPQPPTGVRVRWPGGEVVEVELGPRDLEAVVTKK